MPTIEVKLPARGPRSYAIQIGRGGIQQLGERLQSLGARGKVLLAIDAAIAESHAVVAAQSLRNAGFEVVQHALPADEKHKSLNAVRLMHDAMLQARLDRSSFVVAMGGGIVGDVGGFAAATFMRGLPLVHVPTTLLAMVDAAIGGKTGVNAILPSGALGKNLIGAFWQPHAVCIDPQTLLTLSDRHFRCGLAECLKHALIEHNASTPFNNLMSLLRDHAAAILNRDLDILTDLIARSAAIKAAIVGDDEHESADAGGRALLNLGHTFAHAFESLPELELMHGEAVAIGLVGAMQCSVKTSRFTEQEFGVVHALLAQFGLPTRLHAPASISAVKAAMQFDKKAIHGKVRLVLPITGAKAVVADDVPERVLDGALIAIGAAH